MLLAQKVVLIALLVLGGLCLIVGFTLMHYIGGFMRTVEEESRAQEEAEEADRDGQKAALDPGKDAAAISQTGEER